MMRYHVVIAATAMADIEAQVSYIQSDTSTGAAKWYEGCIAVIESLETMPLRGRIAAEAESFEREIRQVTYHSHRILYEVTDATVVVLHVRHAARRPIGGAAEGATETVSPDD